MLIHLFCTSSHSIHSVKGCLLRITRNGEETHSCVADARFSKTTEAKAAVKFLAMSEGLATWVAELTRAISELVTPAMRNNVQPISAGLDRDCRQLTGRIPELKTERAGSGGQCLSKFESKYSHSPLF